MIGLFGLNVKVRHVRGTMSVPLAGVIYHAAQAFEAEINIELHFADLT